MEETVRDSHNNLDVMIDYIARTNQPGIEAIEAAKNHKKKQKPEGRLIELKRRERQPPHKDVEGWNELYDLTHYVFTPYELLKLYREHSIDISHPFYNFCFSWHQFDPSCGYSLLKLESMVNEFGRERFETLVRKIPEKYEMEFFEWITKGDLDKQEALLDLGIPANEVGLAANVFEERVKLEYAILTNSDPEEIVQKELFVNFYPAKPFSWGSSHICEPECYHKQAKQWGVRGFLHYWVTKRKGEEIEDISFQLVLQGHPLRLEKFLDMFSECEDYCKEKIFEVKVEDSLPSKKYAEKIEKRIKERRDVSFRVNKPNKFFDRSSRFFESFYVLDYYLDY